MITAAHITVPHWRTPHSTLRAMAAVVLDDGWRINDFRVIRTYPEGQTTPRLLVSSPSRPYLLRCPQCKRSRFVTYNYCPHCGIFDKHAPQPGDHQRFIDVAHPTHAGARKELEAVVFKAFGVEDGEAELQGSKYHHAVACYRVVGWLEDVPTLELVEVRRHDQRAQEGDA